jgi:hypothetical protein
MADCAEQPSGHAHRPCRDLLPDTEEPERRWLHAGTTAGYDRGRAGVYGSSPSLNRTMHCWMIAHAVA